MHKWWNQSCVQGAEEDNTPSLSPLSLLVFVLLRPCPRLGRNINFPLSSLLLFFCTRLLPSLPSPPPPFVIISNGLLLARVLEVKVKITERRQNPYTRDEEEEESH